MKILLCTNGKKHVEGAITFSLDLFRRVNPKVTLLYVEPLVGKEEPGEKSLESGLKMIHTFHPKIEVKTKKRKGDVAQEILAESIEGGYDLLVVGSKGVSETIPGVSEFIISDMVDEVIQRLSLSLLVVKEPKPVSKVLACTDGSKSSEGAIRFWGEFKKTIEPKVNILNVVSKIYSRFGDFLEPVTEEQLEILQTLPGKRTQYLYRAKKILAKYGIEAKVRLREGDAVEEILREAERDYDLIVMGFRGRKDPTRPTLGRKAIGVIQRSKIPILVIK